ncbi:hypothetical protein ABVB18_01400 [Xanthomonas citri pv. mangiferaeindicae]|uniref:hypothetical protein n=1 Tax=Xanthomonas citri TaxID=346 RepID=UPI0015590870|nr:hypothetical protein [Xanthomonas citri]UDB89271.1 hypothetical protein LCZ91_04765 [Xanthomonas citri pv. mangiferaeindicae]UDI80807.1 transcriptional regulator [Xanthomonas citri pv. mangiferaeindicae]
MEKQVFDVVQRAYFPGDPLEKMLGKIAAQLSQSAITNGAVCKFLISPDSQP